MQALDPDGLYTDAEVIDALTGRHGSRELAFRYDRLDEQNNFIEPIETMLDASIAQNNLADIKRTARFSLLDRTGINFLKDRIRPSCRLSMPKALPSWTPGAAEATNTYTRSSFEAAGTTFEARRNTHPNSALRGGTLTGYDRWLGSGAITTTYPTGATPNGANRFLRVTWTTASAVDQGGVMISRTAASSVAAGVPLPVTTWVRSSQAITIQPQYQKYAAGVPTTGAPAGGTVALPANTWAQLTYTIPLTGAEDGYQWRFYITGGGNFPVGEYMDITETLETATGPWFDYASSPDADLAPSSVGAANNSASILTATRAAGVSDAGVYRTSAWASQGMYALRVPAGRTATIALTGTQTAVAVARNPGQSMTVGGAAATGEGSGVMRGTGTGSVVLGEGDWDLLTIVGGTYTGPPFSGASPDDAIGPGYVYAWTGAVDGSTSTRTALELTPDTRRGFVQWPLGIFLLSTPTRQASPEGVVTREVLAYDQLVVLRDDKVDTRYSVAAGTAFTTAIATLIAGTSVVSASVVPSALTTTTVREWEPGTSKLRILNDLLDAINYGSAWFDEAGTLICRPYQSPADRAVEWTYSDTGGARLRTGSAEQELDLFDVPNRWVLIKGEPDEVPLVATYTNANPASATSTLSRGRTIVDFRTEQDAADQATLNAKAARLAFESSQVFERVVIETPIMPMHSDSDVLSLKIPSLAMDAKYGEQSWAMPLRVGGRMTHTVRRVVTI